MHAFSVRKMTPFKMAASSRKQTGETREMGRRVSADDRRMTDCFSSHSGLPGRGIRSTYITLTAHDGSA